MIVDSERAICIETAPVIVLGAEVDSVIDGRVVSRVPVSVIPDAITGVAVLPEYTVPLKVRSHSCHPIPLKFKSTEPVDSVPLAETKEPVAVFPDPSSATIRSVFPVSRVPLKEKSTG